MIRTYGCCLLVGYLTALALAKFVVWRPRSERMVLLRHPQGLAQITVENAIGLSLALFSPPA